MSVVQWLFKLYNSFQNGDQAPKLLRDFFLDWVWMLQAEEGAVLLGAFELQIQWGPGNELKP